MTAGARGFSLVELLLTIALTLMLANVTLSIVAAAQAAARVQPEVADLQQRARVGVAALEHDLARAGAGIDSGVLAGGLAGFFPAITPVTSGFTIWRVSSGYAQATLARGVVAGDETLPLAVSPLCPVTQPSCAFSPGAVIVFDATGAHDVVRVTGVTPSGLQLSAGPANAYAAGAAVAQAEVRTYTINSLARQLSRRDESTGSTSPVLDSVVSLDITWLDGAGNVLAPSAFADGPWRGGASLFDVDLLRVRRVRVTLRLETPNAARRGVDTRLFLDLGSGLNPRELVPDATVILDVAPINLAVPGG